MNLLFWLFVIAWACLIAWPALGQPPGAEQAEAWYGWVLVWLKRPGVAAVLAGVAMAFIVPQRVKMDFPLYWTKDKRRFMTRLTSFVCGSLTTLLLWPLFWPWQAMPMIEVYGVLVTGFLTAVLVGAAAPFTYAIIMNQLYKRGWISEMKWSGEARAEALKNGGAAE